MLGELRGDAAEDSFRNFRNEKFATRFSAGIKFACLLYCDLKIRIFDLLRPFDNRLHRVSANLAAIFIEHGAQVFLRLVVFARGHNNGVFNGADYNLRINALLPADPFDNVVKLTSHMKSNVSVSQVAKFQDFRVPRWKDFWR